MTAALSRRELLAAGGVTVFFAFGGAARAPSSGGGEARGDKQKVVAPGLPGDLAKHPLLDAWIRLDPAGRATVFTGKAELGTGVRTALTQIAADELSMTMDEVTLVTADTGRTPDEGVTAGSHTLQDSGTAIANAAANVRYLLAEAAAAHWGVPLETLSTRDGAVRDGRGRSLSYAALASGLSLHVPARPGVPRKRIADHRLIGEPVPRIDIPDKLTGVAAYVQDIRLPGMLHARVVRGPGAGTRIDADAVSQARLPGIARIVRNGSFVAIVGPHEWPLVQALRVLGQTPWQPIGLPPPTGDLADALVAMPAKSETIADRHDLPGAIPAYTIRRRYARPYLMHGAIGPSCAVAWLRDGALTVWTHSQGVAPLRGALADLLRMPAERIRCIHVPGAGCYGHNGADDVAADAALVAVAMPGRPIRLQWSREQEHGWEPLGPAMVAEVEGSVNASARIVGWRHQVWSNTHSTRPSAAGDFLAGTEVDPPFAPTPPKPIPQPEGGGNRNAIPLYALPNIEVVSHFIPAMPLRVSAQRGLGAPMNVFAIESMIDELAAVAGRDPIAFRLAHLADPRARMVVERAARGFGWGKAAPAGRGHGFAFARYKNLGAYCAVAMEAEVIADSGRLIVHRVHAAVDSGEAVNPDGIRNQIEGGIVQSLSWSAYEAVPYDTQRRTAFDWSSYPILRFGDVPRMVAVDVIDRPSEPFLGTGEAAQGPAGAALANAVAAATGARRRTMPLSA